MNEALILATDVINTATHKNTKFVEIDDIQYDKLLSSKSESQVDLAQKP